MREWAQQVGNLTAKRRDGASNNEAVVRKLYRMAIHGSIQAARVIAMLTGDIPIRQSTLSILAPGEKMPQLILDRKRDGETMP